MNKIIVEVSIGELLDKISILEIKQEKIKDPEKLKFISNEYSILKNQLENNVKTDDELDALFKSLKEINGKLQRQKEVVMEVSSKFSTSIDQAEKLLD